MRYSKILTNAPVNDRLTCVDLELIEMIAKGMTSPEMAERTKHTVLTVESMRTRLLKKMGARNVANLVSIAYNTGILKLQTP